MGQEAGPSVRLATALIGAGPAGLLFAIAARRCWELAGHPPEAFVLRVFDKRDRYERTHRMRLDPAPYAELVAALHDPRVDRLAAFLEAAEHRPRVDELEQELLGIAGEFGVRRERLTVGSGPGESDLLAVRALVLDGLPAGTRVTIVGADSVHSAVRALASPEAPRRVTHEQLARLAVTGPGLPRTLSPLHTYRLAKVVASVLEWRLPEPGRAEVDLFLSPREFEAVRGLGATPREPVPVRSEALDPRRAPLFSRFVRALAAGFGEGPCEVALVSSFRLEHAVAPRRVLHPPGLDATVLLVGDAAASLPFQRGMSCLARSALALARAHAAGADAQATLAYDRAVEAITADELRVVGSRARLVSGLREFVRLSALAPFPIQSLFLSLPATAPPPADRPTPGLLLNLLVATAVVIGALAGPWSEIVGVPVGIAPALALPLGFAGGVVYRATRTFEPPPHRFVARVWQVAIGGLLVGGLVGAGWLSATAGRPRQVGQVALWWLVGLAFVAGMWVFEELGRRWFLAGRLDDDVPG